MRGYRNQARLVHMWSVPEFWPNQRPLQEIGAPRRLGHMQAANHEQQDVHLTSLLAALTRSVSETQTLASRFHSVLRERNSRDRNTNFQGPAIPQGRFDTNLESREF